MSIYEYDRFGTCILCSKNMIIEQVIDNKVQWRFTADCDDIEVVLSDTSKMRVCVCKQCKPSFDDSKFDAVMLKVYKGWEHEIENYKWTKEQKSNYLTRYGQLKIVKIAEK